MAALVSADELPVDPDARAVVDGAEVQDEPGRAGAEPGGVEAPSG
ncbi:hypothetical protein ACL00T_15190 [Curtobacterium flaccumfaciens]